MAFHFGRRRRRPAWEMEEAQLRAELDRLERENQMWRARFLTEGGHVPHAQEFIAGQYSRASARGQ